MPLDINNHVSTMDMSLSKFVANPEGPMAQKYHDIATKKAKELDTAIASGEVKLADVYACIDSRASA